MYENTYYRWCRFIGSNLCEYFVEKGYQVRCLDNLATGYIENLDDFIDSPSFEFIEGDTRFRYLS